MSLYYYSDVLDVACVGPLLFLLFLVSEGLEGMVTGNCYDFLF